MLDSPERTSAGRSRSSLHTLVIDSLAEPIAIIDRHAAIVDVNAAWSDFARGHGIPAEFVGTGNHFIDLLMAASAPGDTRVADAARGIMKVLAGKRESFRLEYPTRHRDRERWLLMRVNRLENAPDDLFLVSHFDITERRRAERHAWQLSRHDPLTGLANRRLFDETLDNEMRRSMRTRLPISLIEVDVDRFKEYNDTYGHVAGDRCLVRIAEVLGDYARRPSDLAARLGGDEFALILGDASFESADRVAHGIRQAVESLGIVVGEAREPITVSVGAATARPQIPADRDMLFDATDKALYRAKTAGRNRAVHEWVDLSLLAAPSAAMAADPH